jgi:Tol biopolymer transport system component/DNA-binding winged helix-turn-helix (wHTH) protein
MDESSTGNQLNDGFWVGDWFAEPMLNRVVREDEHVQLEPKVMDVLQLMAEQPGETVTKEAFMDRVWSDTVVTDDVLPRCISQLRKVFGDDAQDPDYIETIRKKGYRLIATVRVPDVEQVADPAPEEESNEVAGTDKSDSASEGERLEDALSGLSGGLMSMATDAGEKWVVVAGGMFERRWVLITIGIALLLAVIVGAGLAFFPGTLSDGRAANPLEAIPLTSFSGHELDPAVSPDGRQVAFTWEGEDQGHRNVYIMQEGANTPLRLTEVEANEWDPTWSPDGQQVAFVRDLEDGWGVFIVSSIGGSERQLAHFPDRHVHSIAWSPNASQPSLVLALEQPSNRTYSLHRLPMEADTLAQITFPPDHSMGDTNPTFSPSGDRIAFTRTLIDRIQDIHAVPAEGGTVTQITTDSTRISGFDWMPRGAQIVFASERGGTSGLWRIAATGGDAEWITTASEGTHMRYLSMARQGGRLAYAQQSRQVDIWKVTAPMDYRAASTERIISSTRWDSSPDVAPDGQRVAFVSNRSGYPEIWTATPSGGALKQITSLELSGTQNPRWSPDSRRIAFVSRQQGNADIYVVNEDGFRPERITRHPAEDLLPSWSPDGTALYVTSNRTGQWEIWKAPVQDGEAPIQMTQGGATAAQEDPDGETLYVVRSDTTGIWAVSLADTSRPFVLAAPRDTASDATADTTALRAAPRQVVAALQPYDRGNWRVGRRGIHFIRRSPGSAVLAFYRFSIRQVSTVFLVDDVPREPSFAAAASVDWFLYTRDELQESDILMVRDLE